MELFTYMNSTHNRIMAQKKFNLKGSFIPMIKVSEKNIEQKSVLFHNELKLTVTVIAKTRPKIDVIENI